MDIMHFSAKEILEMALRIEENGVEFYTQAGSASKSKKLKELFTFLTEEEKKHITIFGEMDSSVPDDTKPDTLDPYLDEASLYLKALANSRVFTNKNEGKRLAGKVSSEEEALLTAINMEKDSILFYNELHNAITNKDKAILGRIIEEEKKHLRKLIALRNNL
jgi:rubrerythrin